MQQTKLVREDAQQPAATVKGPFCRTEAKSEKMSPVT
jgi:hypothetical protein